MSHAKSSQLFVFAHLDTAFVPAGKLTLTEQGSEVIASEFLYGLKYLERPNALELDPLGLSIANKDVIRGQRLFPPNQAAYFGAIRDAAPDAWGRRVIEARHKVPLNSLPESVYLLEAGGNRVGALDVRESTSATPRQGHSPITQLAYLLEAVERIEAGLPIPQNLASIFDSGSALGGARAKATVRDEQGVLWLAKFRSLGEQLDVPAIEAATLNLARLCGLTVPPIKLLEVGGRSVMLIRRFDRYWEGDLGLARETRGAAEGNLLDYRNPRFQAQPASDLQEKRLHFVSGLTLLACDEYSAREKSYAELAQAIRRYCHPALVRENNRELFARMVFNIFVSNDDDHLRNHGFLYYPPALGKSNLGGGWGLSPLYDVMPRPSLATERLLFLGVGNMGRAANLDNAMSACAQFSLADAEGREVISRIWQQVRQWRVAFEDFGLPATTIQQAAPAFRHLRDVCSPSLQRALP